MIQEGVSTVDFAYVKPFRDIGPLSTDSNSGSYVDLAAWTSISLSSPPCQKLGFSNTRFPLYLESYNASAQVKAYELYAAIANPKSAYNNSLFLFEGYSTQGVRSTDESSTAFAFREANILVAPVLIYPPSTTETDYDAALQGNELRQILHEGSGYTDMRVYVNYAYGDETQEHWYGAETWRQRRLQNLKSKYDPEGRFSFYAPIV